MDLLFIGAIIAFCGFVRDGDWLRQAAPNVASS
ncbi:MAG: hypothetical protein QOD67_816 [Caballeronia sp.]|nr:hypothetical protein [Caballeronia sp.]